MDYSQRLGGIAVAGILVGFVIAAFQLLQLPTTPFFGYAIGGAFLIEVATSAQLRQCLYSIALAPLLALCYLVLGGHFGTDLYAVPADTIAFLGLGSCLRLAWRAVWKAAWLPFLTSVTIPLCTVVVGIVLTVLIGLEPRVYDLYLVRFDEALGGQASALVGCWFQNGRVPEAICRIGYQALPLVQSALVASYLRSRHPLHPLFLTMGLAGIAGCALYHVMPVAGPVHIFGAAFTSSVHRIVPLVTTTPIHPTPRNGMPSLHLAWALLVFWNVLPKPRFGRPLAFVFLILIVLATLGIGEHYLVDLIVAVPFAFCIQSACLKRWTNAIPAGAATLAFILYLRFAMPHLELPPVLLWAASAVTVGVPLFLAHRLLEKAEATIATEIVERIGSAQFARGQL